MYQVFYSLDPIKQHMVSWPDLNQNTKGFANLETHSAG